MKTKLFLDSGDPQETALAIKLLGYLDGQTTNPSLIAKNPQAIAYKQAHGVFTLEALLDFYRSIVEEISQLIPQGSVSIEVPATITTTADEMFVMGSKMFGWIPNAHIKFPTTSAGLEAAARMVAEGMRVNMTLCFSQAQAAAVYAATLATKGETLPGYKNVFVSPFIGRLDDSGVKGLDLINTIQRMYAQGDGHVALLAASIRSVDHLRALLAWGVDMATVPLAIWQVWVEQGKPETQGGAITKLRGITYENISLDLPVSTYDLVHTLTDQGIEKFNIDWQSLFILNTDLD